MSLAETLPWAIAAGQNAGAAERNAKRAIEWMNYAKHLEKQVQFYRAEAIQGWSLARAYRKLGEKEFGVNFKEEPYRQEALSLQEQIIPSMAKSIDADAPK